MNLETARHHMIQQQLRTCERMSPDTVDLLYADRREHYVPAALRAFACADVALPLSATAAMLTPKMETRLIETAAVKAGQRVLQIGAGSGHLAALLAEYAQQVWAVEIDPELAEQARRNLAEDGVANVTVVEGDGLAGLPEQAPFDVIVLSGSVSEMPPALCAQLAAGGRLLAVVGREPVMLLRRMTRQAGDVFITENLMDTSVPPLQQPTVSRFAF